MTLRALSHDIRAIFSRFVSHVTLPHREEWDCKENPRKETQEMKLEGLPPVAEGIYTAIVVII